MQIAIDRFLIRWYNHFSLSEVKRWGVPPFLLKTEGSGWE